jgi:hypothetical protein
MSYGEKKGMTEEQKAKVRAANKRSYQKHRAQRLANQKAYWAELSPEKRKAISKRRYEKPRNITRS